MKYYKVNIPKPTYYALKEICRDSALPENLENILIEKELDSFYKKIKKSAILNYKNNLNSKGFEFKLPQNLVERMKTKIYKGSYSLEIELNEYNSKKIDEISKIFIDENEMFFFLIRETLKKHKKINKIFYPNISYLVRASLIDLLLEELNFLKLFY